MMNWEICVIYTIVINVVDLYIKRMLFTVKISSDDDYDFEESDYDSMIDNGENICKLYILGY